MRPILLLILIILCQACPKRAVAESSSSLAILSFFNQNLDDKKWSWLEIGLTDMLITDLSNVKNLSILDREQIQEYINQASLSSSGFLDNTAAIKVSKIAKVNKGLFGYFQIQDGQIEITAFIIDINSNQTTHTQSVKGPTENILDLEKQLVLKIAKNLNDNLTNSEIASLQIKPTDSIDATSRFYNGLAAYDKGLYFDALREFKLSEKQDSSYAKPLLFMGHIYENQGEYEHAILAFKKFETKAPNSPLAARSLFFAANLSFKHFQNDEEALRLANLLIKNFPNGTLPDHTEIFPSLRKHEAIVVIKSHGIHFTSHIHLFKSYIHTATGKYKKALKDINLAETFVPENKRPLYRTYYEWRKWRLIEDAYDQSGIVLSSDLPRVIELNPKKPKFREDYETDKRLKETFQLGSNGFKWGKATLKTYERDKKTKDGYMRNPYHAKENKWYTVEDIYAFSAPQGYVIDSLQVSLKGYQRVPNAISITAQPVGGYPTHLAAGGRRTGKINSSGTLKLLPGTRFIKIRVMIAGDFTKQIDQFSYISDWTLKAKLKKSKNTGSLKIDSNQSIVAFIDAPKGQASHHRTINWSLPFRDCPCLLTGLEAGEHRVVVFATGGHRSVSQDGRRKEFTVNIQQNQTENLDIHFEPLKTQEVAGGLTHWQKHINVAKGIKRVDAGGQIFDIQLLQDSKKHYWILWHQDFDLWFTDSQDGQSWSKPAPLPSPINTQAKESRGTLIQAEDGFFHLAFFSERGNGKGLYVSTSKDMKHWTKPIRAQTLKYSYRTPSLLQLEDGSFRIYYSEKGYKLSMTDSADFKSWSDPLNIDLPEQDFGQIILAKTGKFWLAYAGYVDDEHPLFVASSDDGISWDSHTLIKPSLTKHNLRSFHPKILENNKSEITLGWERTTRLAFSKSKDGIKWSSSSAIKSSNSSASYPDAPIGFIQRHDGKYMIAYTNLNHELWVSLSDNPFK